MKIKVVNWDSHQERADRGNYIWFKFYNKFWEDTKIHGLSIHAKLFFIYCLSVCSKHNADTVDLVAPIALALTGLKSLPLADLVDAGLVQEIDGMCPPRIEEKREDIYRLDLEQIYQLYPKRPNQRKQAGISRLKSTVKTQEDFDAARRAAANYAKYCEAECKDPKYIKQFGTWAGEWREWVEQDAPLMKKGNWHG
jgi:hypothetical protein